MKSYFRFSTPFLLVFLFIFSARYICAEEPSATAPPGEILKQTAEKSVEVRRESQKMADEWAAQSADLRSEIEALKADLENLKWRREKIGIYVKDLEEKMRKLKKKEQAAMEIRNELEPFLDQSLQELKNLSENDLPMLRELQAPRLRATESTLNSADADMVQKTRRLLETTTRALEYGYFPTVDEGEIDVEESRVRVQRLCVGRLGLFALSGDGRNAWKWQRGKNHYEPIPRFARSIEEAIQITQRTRLVSLVELPLGLPLRPEKEGSR